MEPGFFDYFNSFMRWCESNNLTDKAGMLYIRLLHTFNRRGWEEWTSINTSLLMLLANTTSTVTARRARDELAQAGWIEYKPGKKGKPSEYRLLCKGKRFKSGAESPAPPKTEPKPEKAKPKPKKENQSTWAPILPEGTETRFSAQLLAVITDWLTYKHEKRQDYKPTGLKSALTQIEKKVLEFGEAAVIDAIQLSMSNNWKGIVWDRIKPTNERSTPVNNTKD